MVIGNAGAIREGLRKYGPITEMKLADPTFAPARSCVTASDECNLEARCDGSHLRKATGIGRRPAAVTQRTTPLR